MQNKILVRIAGQSDWTDTDCNSFDSAIRSFLNKYLESNTLHLFDDLSKAVKLNIETKFSDGSIVYKHTATLKLDTVITHSRNDNET